MDDFCKEEVFCAHKYLDDLNINRADKKGKKFSLVGRIKQLEKIFYKKLDDVESHYLNNN